MFSINDVLQIYPELYSFGKDRINLRDTLYGIDNVTKIDDFIMPNGTHILGAGWCFDDGNLNIPDEKKEPRIYVEKGKLTFTFTGTSLILRLNLDFGFGIADIRINGELPSLMVGAKSYLDVVDCNLENYTELLNDSASALYYDVLIIENLPNATYTVDLYANNPNGKWFVLSNIKSRSVSSISNCHINGFHAPYYSNLNNGSVNFVNNGKNQIRDIKIDIPTYILKQDGCPFIPNYVTIPVLESHQAFSLEYSIDALNLVDNIPFQFSLSHNYADVNGVIGYSGLITSIPVGDFRMTMVGWSLDKLTPTGVMRAFSNGAGKTVKFRTNATSINIETQMEYGWGTASVKVGTTTYATLTCNDSVGGGFLKNNTVSGLPAGDKEVVITSLNSSSKPFVFTKISYASTDYYTHVNETFTLNYTFAEIPPFPVENPRIENNQITWDTVDLGQQNYMIPMSNFNATDVITYSRFPTFCVNYSDLHHENLEQYDIIICDPRTVTMKETNEWQRKGIKVIGYVSFGEEDGVPSDIYNWKSPLVPHTGDGQGAGGFASYYNKGKNMFAEQSQCNSDGLYLDDSKACSLGHTDYYNYGIGCCSIACANDFRTGGVVHNQVDGKCTAGYTSANNWIRNDSTACSNKSCPKYTPINKNCPYYNHNTGWGQDFSFASDFPDQNGIWGSSFINPLNPKWKERLLNFYLPVVFGQPQVVHEVVTLSAHIDPNTNTPDFVFRVKQYPFDKSEKITLSTYDSLYTYQSSYYTYDATTGVFSIATDAGIDDGMLLSDGQQLLLTYTKKGLNLDGLFMDTVDTVDVYPSPAYQQAFTDMINDIHDNHYPNKYFCSNRGFSILPNIIKSCKYVMFECFASDYNFDTKKYSLIDDADSISYNNKIRDMLRSLRKHHKFDVLGLNYCKDGVDGDEIRTKATDRTYKEGWLSWCSEISLDNPPPNTPLEVNLNGAVRRNFFKQIGRYKLDSA